jgi:Putative DNA-binding domain/NB-ARC domain
MTSDIRGKLLAGSFPENDEWFLSHFIQDDGTFLSSEGENWDFKEEWPFSYSDAYFQHLMKLVLAFTNTSGGLIIFGVNDETRRVVKRGVRVNVDKFISSGKNIIDNFPIIDHRKIFMSDEYFVDVIIIYPTKFITEPACFKDEFSEKQNISKYWIRESHETIAASSKHIPLLFCGAARALISETNIESSLPPNPANIKQFVGRLNPIGAVFKWIRDAQESRAFLYGRGGSGKTTIAYEVAKYVSIYGKNIQLSDGSYFDTVIFITAKEKELRVEDAITRDYQGCDFSDTKSQIIAILELGGWSSQLKFEDLSLESLKMELQEFLDNSSNFIVIDDIDTLTTKKIDAGFDILFRALARAKRVSKVLYTQRNAPTQSLANSIEVPGLSKGDEYESFIEVCAEQFRVEKPNKALAMGRLAEVTERRPLVIEIIVALRRNSGDYDRALGLFEANVGTDARSYVFEREWDTLGGEYSKHLLCALALINRPLGFEDFKTILRYEESKISEAINATREMFLDVYENGENSTYRLGDLTRAYVSKKALTLDRYGSIEARVNSFKRTFFPDVPELSRLVQNVDYQLRSAEKKNDNQYVVSAWEALLNKDIKPKITEDPRFRALRANVASRLDPPKLDFVREDFEYAFSMNYEPPEEYIFNWYKLEESSGEMSKYCLDIIEYVEGGKTYSAAVKLSYMARKAGYFYRLGKDNQFTDLDEAFGNFEDSLKIHSEVFYRAIRENDRQLYRYENYFGNTALHYFGLCLYHSNIDGVIDAVVNCAKLDRSIIDPFYSAINQYLIRFNFKSFSKAVKNRAISRIDYLITAISSKAKWDDEKKMQHCVQLYQKFQSMLKET